jgi:hypothetical protein
LDVKKRFSEEQIIGFLREAEAGLTCPQSVCQLLVRDCLKNRFGTVCQAHER